MIIDVLKTTLANHVEISMTVQGFHWNVESKDFKQFHELFDVIYTDVHNQIDLIAEYIRTLSGASEYVNPMLEIMIKNRTVQGDFIVGNKTREMCKEILKLNTTLLEDYSEIFNEAMKENEQGLANWAAERLDKISHNNWMIIAITKE